MVESSCPCARAPCRGPMPPPAMPRLPVNAGRHPIARAESMPPSPLCIELPPRMIMAGFVVAYRPASATIPSPGVPGPAAPPHRAAAGCRPQRVVARDVLLELVEPDGVAGDEVRVVQTLGDDHVHHRQSQSGI